MNRLVLNDLHLICGIDTFEITTDYKIPYHVNGITTKNHLEPCSLHGALYKYKVNPDKIIDGAGNNIDLFKQVLNVVIENFGASATELYISRIDYRFDDMTNDYNRFYKLNRLLLSMVAVRYKSKNNFASSDLLTAEKLTVRFDCDNKDLHISGEYYNKARQEPSGEIKTRLEIRSRQLYIPFTNGCDYESFVLCDWLERLTEVITKECFNAVVKVTTDSLIDRYSEEKSEFGNVTEFLACYRDSIYTTRQLTQLYSTLNNAETARQCAYKYRHGDKKHHARELPCFALKDLQLYLEKLKESAFVFFGTQTEDAKAA